VVASLPTRRLFVEGRVDLLV